MDLCIDVGNTNLCGGVFKQNNLLLQFRFDSKLGSTSDELGVFLRGVLKENEIKYNQITAIGIASVVPSLDYSICSACIKYFNLKPIFLSWGTKTGVVVKTTNPQNTGADLIAGVMAAKDIFPHQKMLVFDFGTATTCCYINERGEFIGYSIAPGFKLMAESLHTNTAKLMQVNLVVPERSIGNNTKTSIQSGVFYAQLGWVKQLQELVGLENNLTSQIKSVATGGFASLFKEQDCFDVIVPELVLLGVKKMLELNQ